MDRDYLIDLVISIVQDCADEWHSKETISSLEKERSEVNPDEMPALYDKLTKDIQVELEDWLEGVNLRREKMDALALLSPAYDYHKRCRLKHRATAFVTAVETYQANPSTNLYNIMQKSEKRFWKALCQFMGVDEITDCGRCLSDQLVKIHKEQQSF